MLHIYIYTQKLTENNPAFNLDFIIIICKSGLNLVFLINLV